MNKETKLVKKVKRLIRRLGCPRWLHHYGPKKYELLDHLTALLIRANFRLSYRRVVYFLDLLGIKCPSKSALQYTAAKLTSGFWQKILSITAELPRLAAIDGTGFSRTNPSYHYLKRIDGKIPSVPVKLSAIYNIKQKKFCAANIRVTPAHDIRDAKKLLKLSKPKILVADKAYDARWLHEFCKTQNIEPHIPVRKWGKPRFRNYSLRMLSIKKFKQKTYNQRGLIECGFSVLKRKFGGSVSSRKARTIRSELYGRLICHNIFYWLFRLLGQSRLNRLCVLSRFY